jgi:nitroreductase
MNLARGGGSKLDTALSQEHNELLDEIIVKRRSVRAFISEIPPKRLIEQVMLAGLQAPYAGLAVKEDLPYRLFRVICQGSNMLKVMGFIQEQARVNIEQFKTEMSRNAHLQESGQAFMGRLENLAENGIPGLKNAPYFIVVAERRGIPPVEFESLAHCLENMWLKATALGLGFQVLSATKMLTDCRPFFEMTGLQYGEFAVNGCVVGYPQQLPPEKRLFPLDEITAWI